MVVLGGTHREPGVTPYADRNVWSAPRAAAAVLAAPFRDVLLVTADATAAAALDDAAPQRWRRLGTPAARAAADLAASRLDRGARVHDPLAVAALLDPGLLTTLRAAVRVECTDPTTYGATRFAAEVDEERGRVAVAVAADRARYLELLTATLGRQMH
nr:nucleoside hydrolase [Nocardioides kongjuensis]